MHAPSEWPEATHVWIANRYVKWGGVDLCVPIAQPVCIDEYEDGSGAVLLKDGTAFTFPKLHSEIGDLVPIKEFYSRGWSFGLGSVFGAGGVKDACGISFVRKA